MYIFYPAILLLGILKKDQTLDKAEFIKMFSVSVVYNTEKPETI